MKKGIKKIIFGGLISLSLVSSFYSHAQTKEEFLDKFLDDVYETMLNRESDQDGKAYWSEKILGNSIGILDFLNQILSQEEFENLGVSSEDFINRSYNLLMNRNPDEDGFNYWINEIGEQPNSEKQLGLINSMAHSDEFLGKINDLGILLKNFEENPSEGQVDNKEDDDINIFIKNSYEYILGRQYDSDGLEYWRNQLVSKNKGALDLINNFLSLDEFKNRELSDKEFINIIYRVLFNREADSDGLNYWNSIYQKDKSSNRMSKIVLDIADDKEFLSKILEMNLILKKIDLSLFHSELLTKKNNVRGITSEQLSEIKKNMTFFDIIVKLGRTRNVSSVDGIDIAKYIVDGSKEMYFIFSDPSSFYKFDPMEVLKNQN